MGYSIIILGHERPNELRKAVKCALLQRPRADVVAVWQNAPSAIELPAGVMDVRCSVNSGCISRYALATLLTSRAYVFCDDDTYMTDPSIARTMVEKLDESPVVGPRSRQVYTDGNDAPYSSAPDFEGTGPTGVVKGLLHAATAEMMPRVLELYRVFPDCGNSDDILLSAACGLSGEPPRQVWLAGVEYVYTKGVGLCQTAGHYTKRDEVCIRLAQKMGWEPERWYRA